MEVDNSKAARKIYEMNQLRVSQSDGIVRTGTGEIVGKRKWILNVEYSLDSKEAEDFIVNAATEEEANEIVEKLLLGVAQRKGMTLGSIFTNFASPKEAFDVAGS